MGAFAGSAALKCGQRIDHVSVVTLTINNVCNLKCPHCYLQYAAPDRPLSQDVLDGIWASSASTVSVVGMEPLANRKSAELLSKLILDAKALELEVGFITNGLNAHLLDGAAAKAVDWVDVSIDGTAASYADFRGASFAKLVKGISTLHDLGVSEINLLQTVGRSNLPHLAEMAAMARTLGASKTILSPFCRTRSEGAQHDLAIGADEFLAACRAIAPMSPNAWLVMDQAWLPNHIAAAPYSTEIASLFGGQAIIFEADPIHYGMVRVTYEGEIMSPRQAMHTVDYGTSQFKMPDSSIESFRQSMVAGEVNIAIQQAA
jgi:sulfatase maturation enzyme AslB (radical SAM superfamily)